MPVVRSVVESEPEKSFVEEPAVAPSTVAPRLIRGAAIAVLASIVLYGGMLFVADANALAQECAKLTAARLWLLVGVSSAHVLFRYVRWEYYLRRLELAVPFADSVLICLSGFAMSLSPGKLGEVLKSVMLHASIQAPIARTAPIVIAERLTDVAGLVLLGALGLGIGTGAWWYAWVLMAGVVCMGAVVGSRTLGIKVATLASAPRRLQRYRAKLIEMLAALGDMVSPSAYAFGTLLSVAAWGAHGATLMLAADAFAGVDLSLWEAQTAYSAPLLAGTLAMIPGGVGLTEASMAGAILQLGGTGTTPAIAAAITIVVRAITFWITIAIGVLALVVWQARARRRARRDGAASSR